MGDSGSADWAWVWWPEKASHSQSTPTLVWRRVGLYCGDVWHVKEVIDEVELAKSKLGTSPVVMDDAPGSHADNQRLVDDAELPKGPLSAFSHRGRAVTKTERVVMRENTGRRNVSGKPFWVELACLVSFECCNSFEHCGCLGFILFVPLCCVHSFRRTEGRACFFCRNLRLRFFSTVWFCSSHACGWCRWIVFTFVVTDAPARVIPSAQKIQTNKCNFFEVAILN